MNNPEANFGVSMKNNLLIEVCFGELNENAGLKFDLTFPKRKVRVVKKIRE